METGGFPEVVLAGSNLRRNELLSSCFRTVFFKVYLMDHGFAAVPLAYSENLGLLLENVVATELLRRGRKFCYYRGKGECDFITDGDESGRCAIQVSWALNETNQQREFDSLLEAAANAGASSCIVITSGDRSTFERDGRTIEILPAWQWLMESFHENT
jgi:predicted AAA+ superfamily ATPase